MATNYPDHLTADALAFLGDQSVLQPYPIDSSTCIVGPIRSTADHTDLTTYLFNQATGDAPPFADPNHVFNRSPIVRTWPWTPESDTHSEWRKWSQRVEAAYGEEWKKTYIYDTINFCRHGFAFDTNLLSAASYFWSRSMNAFCFPWGPMSPTILDVSVLTGFPIIGDEVTPHIVREVSHQLKISKSRDKTYGVFITTYRGAEGTPVTRDEHIRFLTLWLCQYIFCSRSIQVTHEFFNLAICLADGNFVDLSSGLLAFLHRCLYEFITDPNSSPFGPLWFLQLWLYVYFVDLRPPGHRLSALPNVPLCCCFATAKVECSSFQTYFEFFYTRHTSVCPSFSVIVENMFGRP